MLNPNRARTMIRLVKNVEQPFYIYDWQVIENQFKKLQKSFIKQGIGVYYSAKANSNLAIVKKIYDLGLGLEVASIGELKIVKKIGANPKRVSFAGPVKTKEELEFAVKFGIEIINIESLTEAKRLNQIAGKLDKVQKIGIRVNSPFEVEGAGGLMGGGSKKFGFDLEKVDKKFIKEIQSFKNLDLIGLHVFSATQVLREKGFLANIKSILEIAEKLNRLYEIKYIDFGGGLGIPYRENEKELDLIKISKEIQKFISKFNFIKQNDAKLFIEPGRYLVGESGAYVCKVDNVKISRGKRIVLVDGGIQHFLRSALGFGNHPTYNLSNLRGKLLTYDIGGSLCTSLDFLGKDIKLSEVREGDLIGIFNAGAYGFSESMPFFLSHPTPTEILIENNKAKVIRKSFDTTNLI